MKPSDRHFENPSVTRRMACMLYEALLLIGVIFMATLLFSVLTQSRDAMSNRAELQVFLVFVTGLYFVIFWSRGQTLAMKTWRLHIQLANGAEVPALRALLRYLLAWLWVLPPLALSSLFKLSLSNTLALAIAWVLLWSILGWLRNDRQLLHDIWSGTRLVYDKRDHNQTA